MNWISNFVRPKLGSLFTRRDVPSNLWHNCDSCSAMLFHRELAQSLNVCPNCDHHMQIAPRQRFESLFDLGVFEEIRIPGGARDPLEFRDKKRYTDRIKAARNDTGEKEAMLLASGRIGDTPIIAAGQDFAFMGGSLGIAVGSAIVTACREAIKQKAPLVLFSASGGARMQEGLLALMQMPRTTAALQMLREDRLPFIVVLTHPTTGGVTASYAMLGDIQLAEPGALIGFAGPRVIEQTIRERLPDGFQRSAYLHDHGMLDRVTHRKNLRDELISIVRMLMKQPPPIRGELAAPSTANVGTGDSGDPAGTDGSGGKGGVALPARPSRPRDGGTIPA